MLRTLSIIRRQRRVVEITAPPTHNNLDERRDAYQIAAEIRAQGSAADVAADSARAYVPNPFPPQRPKHPAKEW
jgi:hypothetical protein